LLLAATVGKRLGIEQTADQLSDMGERPGAAHPGRKLLTLVHSMPANPRPAWRVICSTTRGLPGQGDLDAAPTS